jgi:magnesium-transporting ATPase (P-type)
MGEIMVIFLAMLAGLPLPLTAIQLLVLNLITDGAPALALGLEKGEPDIMDRPPRPVEEPVINRQMVWGIAVQTIAITAATLIAFIIGPFHFRTFPGLHLALGTLPSLWHRCSVQQVHAMGRAGFSGHPAEHHLCAFSRPHF